MNKRGLPLLLLVAAAMVLPEVAWSKNEALKGLTIVRPFVARVSEGGRSCGLSTENLSQVVNESISQSGLKTAEDAVVYFYVNVTTVHLTVQDFCVSGITIDVYTRQYVDLAVTQTNAPVTITLWESGSLFGGPRIEQREQVWDALRGRTDSFAKDCTAPP